MKDADHVSRTAGFESLIVFVTFPCILLAHCRVLQSLNAPVQSADFI